MSDETPDPTIDIDDVRPGNLLRRKTKRRWNRGARAYARKIREEAIDKLPAMQRCIAAYCRVSTDTQDLAMQADVIARTAAAGTIPEKIDRWYQDTASGVANRENLNALLKAASRGQITRVYFYAIDRLGRSLLDIVRKMHFFERCGTKVVFCLQRIDTTDTMGMFVFHVLAAFAEMERKLIKQRCADGTRRRRLWHGNQGAPKFIVGADMRDRVIAFMEQRIAEDGRFDWKGALKIIHARGKTMTDKGTDVRRPMSISTLRNRWDEWHKDGYAKTPRSRGYWVYWNGKLRPQDQVPPDVVTAILATRKQRMPFVAPRAPVGPEGPPPEPKIEVTDAEVEEMKLGDVTGDEWSSEPPQSRRESESS